MLDCPVCSALYGGLREKKNVESFPNYILIAMEKLSKEMNVFLQISDSKGLAVQNLEELDGVLSAKEGRGKVSENHCNACVIIHVPTMTQTYLSVQSDWISQSVGEE